MQINTDFVIWNMLSLINRPSKYALKGQDTSGAIVVKNASFEHAGTLQDDDRG